MSDTAERVKKIVVEHLNVDADKVTENASFIEDLGADSLDTVELVMAFEEEFGIEIPDDAAESIVTVGDAVKFIDKSAGLSRTPAPRRMRRVVITGLGLVTPLACGVEETWSRLLAGKSGAGRSPNSRSTIWRRRSPATCRAATAATAPSMPISGSIPRSSAASTISSSSASPPPSRRWAIPAGSRRPRKTAAAPACSSARASAGSPASRRPRSSCTKRARAGSRRSSSRAA